MERLSDKKRRNGIITGRVFHIHVYPYMYDNLTKRLSTNTMYVL